MQLSARCVMSAGRLSVACHTCRSVKRYMMHRCAECHMSRTHTHTWGLVRPITGDRQTKTSPTTKRPSRRMQHSFDRNGRSMLSLNQWCCFA
eukprot:6266539-Amphidinium_carterae.2